MSRCAEWLKCYLRPEMAEVNAARKDALEAGFTKHELKEARKELGVRTHHQIDAAADPRVDNWFWQLPKEDA